MTRSVRREPRRPACSRAGWLAGWVLAALCLAAGGAVAQDGGSRTCPGGGVAFTDVADDHFAAADIECLVHLGIIKGTSAVTFSPDRAVTRAESAALLARLWRGLGETCPVAEAPFGDVGAGFARADIACLHAAGIIRGTGPDRFSPDLPVTRAQAAAFLARLVRTRGRDCPVVSHPFADVPDGHFAGADISCLHGVGIIRGTGPDRFSPDLPVTRAQVAALLARVWRGGGTPAGGTAPGPVGGGGSPGGGGAPIAPGPAPPWLAADTEGREIVLDWPRNSEDGSRYARYEMRYRKAPATTWTLYETAGWLYSQTPPEPFDGFNVADGVFGYGDRYTIQIKASTGLGWSRWSPSVVVVVGSPARPAEPVLEVGHESLGVSWTAPSNNNSAINGYEARYRTTGAGSWASLSAAGYAQGLTITSLTNGAEYEVGVRAVNARGAGQWSSSARARPVRATAPGVPTGLVLNPSSAQVAVSWNAPAANGNPLSGYEVQYRSTGGAWTDQTHTGLTTGATVTGLTNGAEYQVRVRSANTRQSPTAYSDWTPTAAATPQASSGVGAPPAPTGLGLVAGHQQIAASWTPPSYTGPVVTGYYLRYKTSDASAWTTVTDPVTVTVATITGLTGGAGYDVAVNAANHYGSGPWSAAVTATLPSVPDAPPAPTMSPGDQEIEVSWTLPASDLAPITGYNVRYRPTGGTWADHSHTGLSNLTTVTGLTNDTQYEVQINAVNSHGTGEWSPSAKTTPGTAPVACAPGPAPAPTVRTSGLVLLVVHQIVGPGCPREVSQHEFRYKAAGVSTWTTKFRSFSYVTTVTLDSGISYGVEYEIQYRGRTTRYGPGPWSPIVTATPMDTANPTPAYTLDETGVEDRSQTWTVYLCGGGDLDRHPDLDTADEYATFFNTKLTPKLAQITGAEYQPSFVAGTGEMPTGIHTGGYSLYYACKAENGQHLVIGHHSAPGYGGAAVQCGPTGWQYAFVSLRQGSYDDSDLTWLQAGHEIGHTLGWSHYRSSLDPWEFMRNGPPNEPYDQGEKSSWCGGSQSQGESGKPPAPTAHPWIR